VGLKMFFYIFLGVLVIQRIVELFLARKNEIWIKGQGGIEFGKNHYRLMVLIHSCFFLSLFVEVTFLRRTIIPNWWFPLGLFLLTQAGRIWVIKSLGKYWNTKILVVPDANIITKGPYKFLKHPNYMIVTLELMIIPYMFQAYYTLIAFFLFNQLLLSIRIPIEERILVKHTNYLDIQSRKHRFFPSLKRQKSD
jgi:methyltransferase